MVGMRILGIVTNMIITYKDQDDKKTTHYNDMPKSSLCFMTTTIDDSSHDTLIFTRKLLHVFCC